MSDNRSSKNQTNATTTTPRTAVPPIPQSPLQSQRGLPPFGNNEGKDDWRKQVLHSGKELLSGTFAGIVGTVFGHPLDTVKVIILHPIWMI